MTNHVRTSYRHHRTASWALATVLTVAIAAVAIPLAIGAAAADKTYKLTLSPTATCVSPASTTVTIKNTGSPQTLGSAEIYFPPGTIASVLPTGTPLKLSTSTTTSNGPKDILALDNLALAPGTARMYTVTFKAGVSFSATINAVAKQSNRFNDSGGGANLFTHDGTFPTLKVVQCVEVSGRVYQDRNLDFGYVTGDGAFNDSDIPKAWTVKLFAKDVGAPPTTSYSLINTVTATSASDPDPLKRGAYTFPNVPTLADYKVCVSVPAGDAADNAVKWGLQRPAGNQECGPISTATGGPSTSAGKLLPNLAAGASSPNTDFQVVPVVGPFGTSSTSTIGGYTVTAGGNTGQKSPQLYVQDTWVDEEGRTNFRFSPILPCGQPGGAPATECSKKIYLLEKLEATIALDTLDGQQASLLYDDEAPFLDGQLNPMPYCEKDPRPVTGTVLLTVGVMPAGATSCIVEGSQKVVAGGDVDVEYWVYTAYDGGRQIGLG